MDEERIENEEKEAFKQAKVFTKKEEYYGIPSKLFYNTVAIPIALIIAFQNLFGVLVAIIMFIMMIVPLYHIHREDPFALTVWIRCMFRRHQRWCAGKSDQRTINIIKREEF